MSWPGLAVVNPVELRQIDARRWELLRPLIVVWDGRGNHLLVDRGYVTDGASVPRLARLVMGRHGRKLAAAIVHDALYTDDAGPAGSAMTRREADRLFRALMAEAGVPWITRALAYAAARVAGGAYWRDGVG